MLKAWSSDMMARINADELANDVTGAEALVDKHQEYKVSMCVFFNVG